MLAHRRQKEYLTIVLKNIILYTIVITRERWRRRSARAGCPGVGGVRRRFPCGCGWRGAPRPGRVAPGSAARHTLRWTSVRIASPALSACGALPLALRQQASRASPTPAGTRSPHGSAFPPQLFASLIIMLLDFRSGSHQRYCYTPVSIITI